MSSRIFKYYPQLRKLNCHPITGNPINGHEWRPQNNEDLQYACIFDLAPALQGRVRDCNAIAQQVCDCFDTTDGLTQVNARMKPVCHGADGYSSVQLRAKAYPGRRHIDVMRRYGDNSVVASFCPKVLKDPATGEAMDSSNPNYGYNPALNALIERFKDRLDGD